jgi:hypothetical protein
VLRRPAAPLPQQAKRIATQVPDSTPVGGMAGQRQLAFMLTAD